ncbi:MAG: GNAT family N-acetyltransferase [Anaerolineae bacterium]|nr:GNAT family N-acetyltransferase [Anaerolineae bacterium]MCB0200039.1 GNAT family N-acetyltransferase [Anaerolineae bacterium]MCB0206307.1 GNAT family N-acetyltransferase [Anaerolineae bacterium]MCB0254304.1 GNAT family N-acetyltransferase [Anaerolineae bacterium]
MSTSPNLPAPPDEWTQFSTRDGLAVRVRPEREGDAPYLVDLFNRLSPDSRYLRFSKSMVNPDPERVRQEAERLSHLGPPQEMAWLAFADLPDQPDAPVAGVRYVMTASDTAELAISVRDDLQRRGIGSALLVFACQQARRQGLHYLTAVFRSENKAVWSLVRHSPFHTTSVINGSEISLRIDLTDRAG